MSAQLPLTCRLRILCRDGIYRNPCFFNSAYSRPVAQSYPISHFQDSLRDSESTSQMRMQERILHSAHCAVAAAAQISVVLSLRWG